MDTSSQISHVVILDCMHRQSLYAQAVTAAPTNDASTLLIAAIIPLSLPTHGFTGWPCHQHLIHPTEQNIWQVSPYSACQVAHNSSFLSAAVFEACLWVMASHQMAWERVVRETSVSRAAKSCSKAHPSIAQDWLEVKHVYIPYCHCWECEDDPWYEQKDWLPGHNSNVVAEPHERFALNSQKVQQPQEQSCVVQSANGP